MPREFPRSRRVGEQLHRELMQLLRTEVKDPRAALVTITAVEVSRDLAYAKVFFTLLDNKHAPDEVAAALNGAAGFLRHELSRIMLMRSVPQLKFVFDASLAHAAHMDALISEAVRSDTRKHEDDSD